LCSPKAHDVPIFNYFYMEDIDKIFWRLTILSEATPIIYKWKKRRRVLCKCKCGVIKEYLLGSLKTWRTSSCWCLRKELTGVRFTTHWLFYVQERNVWNNMKMRCTNKNNEMYKYYGLLWIRVCDRWIKSFENFYADMWPRPSELHSIDRINTSWNYEPNNCKWSTMYEQTRNRKSNIILEYEWKNLCAKDISKKLWVKYDWFMYKLKKWLSVKEIENLI
jgi:hypothetical protein